MFGKEIKKYFRIAIGASTLLFLGVLGFSGGVSAFDTEVLFYPETPGATFDERISGTVEGKPVLFEYQETTHPAHIHFMESSRVRFASNGPVSVEIDITGVNITKVNLRTVGKDMDYSMEGSKLSFDLCNQTVGHIYQSKMLKMLKY